jgi:SAM-dependent methyltransferase/SOS-response transcriptional repressor LexA
MDDLTKAFYATHATRVAAGYSRAEVAMDLLAVFSDCRKVLDLGCGSGRDLAALLRGGKDAYGVDAVPAMVQAAAANLATQGIATQGRVFQTELPDLGMFADAEFDGVLCSAVLMHLPDEMLFDAIYAIRRVLRPGGRLRVSMPSRRADVNPRTRRDADGRLFTDLAPAKLQLLLERVGFSRVAARLSNDSLGRAGIEWWCGDFSRLSDAGDRPLHLVESILNRDKKDATYKLALFRALAEIAQAQSHLAAYTLEEKVKIPLSIVAEKWILYYWPIFESEVFIPQRTNERPGQGLGVAIRKPLEGLIKHFQSTGGLTGFYSDWKGGRLKGDAARVFNRALSQFQSTIHTMPAKHAGGGHYDVFQYDGGDKSLVMDVALWRELCLMGSWIRDATILRWAEQTEIFAKGAVKASVVIDRLLLAPDQGRNVNEAQKFFATLPSRPCVWSQKELGGKSFAVDHAMPFSYWRNNDLWNLFPAAPEINANKSDKLPTYRQLHGSRDIIVDYWRGLEGSMGVRFEREAQTLLGRESFQKGNWETLLFSRFVEAFELTANQRGAERWQWPGLPQENKTTNVQRMARSSVRYPETEEKSFGDEPVEFPAGGILRFSEVGDRAFKTCLPLVGALAAGTAFHGLETDSLDELGDVDWVEVPARWSRKNRFVVRVAGVSMEPTLKRGELVVFEYHRSPRRDGEIVIANLPEFGADSTGTETIKRIKQDADHWIFEPDNPAHDSIRVSKTEITHPILGTFVAKL